MIVSIKYDPTLDVPVRWALVPGEDHAPSRHFDSLIRATVVEAPATSGYLAFLRDSIGGGLKEYE